MSEGRNYRCDLESTDQRVTMRVRNRGITVSGSTWDEAYERLIGAIIEKTGDGEPQISFGGPFPTQAADHPYLAHRWTVIYPHGSCMTRWMTSQLFSRGSCDLCGAPRGKRNRIPLIGETGSCGDYCNAWTIWDETRRTVRVQHGFSPVFVSERFLDLLNDRERAECDWLQVVPHKRSRSRFYECIPRHFLRPVGHRNWEAYCVECDMCGNITLRTSPTGNMNDFSKLRITDWYAKDDLRKASDHPIIAVGNPGNFMLVWPLERAKEIAQSKRAVGFSLGPFGVIPRAELRRRPKPVLFSKEHKDEFKDYQKTKKR